MADPRQPEYLPAPLSAPIETWEVERELREVADAISALHYTTVPVLHAAPAQTWTGRLVIADGTDWNPGSGRGLYWYDEDTGTWKFIS